MENQKSDMKKHSGKSIQAWAADVRTVIIVSTVIFALIQFFVFAGIAGIGAGILLGIFTLGVGCFLAWIGECILHGFGELVENSAETASYLRILAAHFAPDTVKAMEAEAGKAAEP